MTKFEVVNNCLEYIPDFNKWRDGICVQGVEVLYKGHTYRLISEKIEIILSVARERRFQILCAVISLISVLASVYLSYKEKSNSSTPLPPNISIPTLTPLPISKDAQKLFFKKLFDATKQISFWEGFLNEYNSLVNCEDKSSTWNQPKAVAFLQSELRGLENEIEKLEKIITDINAIPDIPSCDDGHQVSGLNKLFQNLKNKRSEALTVIENKMRAFENSSHSQSAAKIDRVQGLGNAGGSCYINSALQPLLVTDTFSKLRNIEIHQREGETPDHFSGRKKILDVFKNFLNAWYEESSVDTTNQAKDFRTKILGFLNLNSSTPASKLGGLIGNLRKTIFEVGLDQGAFQNLTEEYRWQDAGSFFELIQHVIGHDFELKYTKQPLVSADGAQLLSQPLVKTTFEGVLYLKGQDSIQNLVNKYQNGIEEELSSANLWRLENGTTVQKFIEYNKILGQPPELIVFRVDNRIIDPAVDLTINLAALFEERIEAQDARYELTGFSQNRNQSHWTSVVHENGKWKYCDDSHVSEVPPDDWQFRHPANYVVYKRRANTCITT